MAPGPVPVEVNVYNQGGEQQQATSNSQFDGEKMVVLDGHIAVQIRAGITGQVTAGYTILQPRTQIKPTSANQLSGCLRSS